MATIVSFVSVSVAAQRDGAALEGAAGPWPDGAFQPTAVRVSPGEARGSAILSPETFRAASIGDYVFEFTTGSGGIAKGGGIMVDFPKAWFTNPAPLRKPIQQDDPSAPHFVGIKCSSTRAKPILTIDKLNFDGKNERFRNMMTILVEGKALEPGDTISVTLANTTAPYIAGPDAVDVAVDSKGNGQFRLLPMGASYTVASLAAATIGVFAPSQGVVGTPVEIRLTAFDRFYNVAESFIGAVQVAGLDESPLEVEFETEHKGLFQVRWIPRETGIRYLHVQATPQGSGEGAPLQAFGGPLRIFDEPPAMKIYWGDLHSHSSISKDGIGANDFGYARDATGLDFFASTEHDINDAAKDSITPSEWQAIRDNVRDFYDPGRFVTLLAYEASLGAGHHNVFYRNLDGFPWASHRLRTVDAIWEKLERGDAITIPHHLGIRWGLSSDPIDGPGLQEVKTGTLTYPGGPQLNWTGPHAAELRPLLEIYSKHGTSEFYDPSDPLAYEQVRYTGATSVDGPHYARDAWAQDLELGVVAASDNHVAQPGLSHTGLTAVLAPELTRDAVFDALKARRSYGTTGERIVLEFEVAGVSMGQRGKASGSVEGSVLVAAPRDIRLIEILKRVQGSPSWTVSERWNPQGKYFKSSIRDVIEGSGVTYYLRVELRGTVGGRVSRAWSSPVWLRP